jgi:hypothetical protein
MHFFGNKKNRSTLKKNGILALIIWFLNTQWKLLLKNGMNFYSSIFTNSWIPSSVNIFRGQWVGSKYGFW